ncbi:hypothetical protein ABEB36_003290 [Hypothenemus hampei]|uniref:Gustatory receptor n=1 Tax=Hypothenemus hampei TaxID=57062 RepID=A0ABD1F8N9_HYPHA
MECEMQVLKDLATFGGKWMLARHSQKTGLQLKIWKVVGTFNILLVSVLSAFCVTSRLIYIHRENVPKMMLFLLLVKTVAATLLCVISIRNSCFGHIGQFNEIQDGISRNCDLRVFSGATVSRLYPWLMKLNIVSHVFVKIIFILIYKQENDELFPFLVNCFPEIYAMIVITFQLYMAFAWIQYLKRRHEYVLKTTRKLKSSRFPNYLVLIHIRRLEKLIRFLYKFFMLSKEMFGITIFLSTMMCIFGVFYSIAVIIVNGTLETNKNVQICDMFSDCVILMVFIVTITLSLDKLEIIAKKLPKSIYLVRNQFENEEIRRELRFFAKYSKELSPKFTAGCFKLDRHLLSSSLSTLTTYIIVVIQFSVTTINTSED